MFITANNMHSAAEILCGPAEIMCGVADIAHNRENLPSQEPLFLFLPYLSAWKNNPLMYSF